MMSLWPSGVWRKRKITCVSNLCFVFIVVVGTPRILGVVMCLLWSSIDVDCDVYLVIHLLFFGRKSESSGRSWPSSSGILQHSHLCIGLLLFVAFSHHNVPTCKYLLLHRLGNFVGMVVVMWLHIYNNHCWHICPMQFQRLWYYLPRCHGY